jgi:hypothetical protein
VSMLSIVNCCILSSTHNCQVDAYVLSERSMFVSKRRSAKSSKHQDYVSTFRFILKTCGTTTLLDCIEELTKLVKEYAGFDTVELWILKCVDKTRTLPLLLQEIFYSQKISRDQNFRNILIGTLSRR